MMNAIKIRIYPTPTQQEKLSKAFGCARWYWNNSLAETVKLYKETGKGLGQYEMNARLPKLKDEFEWLRETHSQVLQSVSLNLSRSFVNFFEKRAKFPKFKSKHDNQSIQYPQDVKIVEGRKIFIPKIGHVKAIIHREIVGKIKTVTISKNASGKYFASILSDDGMDAPRISYEGKVLGVDVGLTHLAITSDGSKFDNPKLLKKAEKNLKRKQRKLSRKKLGSKTREKAKLLVAKAHEKVANCRKDYLHKLSRRLVNESQVIATENLNVKAMVRNPNLSKSISDAGWGMLKQFLKYKTERAGKGFVEIDRFYPSSKTCSCCGFYKKKLPLNIRSWKCDNCSAVLDRDVNAANNIAQEAQRLITAGMVVTASGGNVRKAKGRKSSTLSVADEARNFVL